MNYLYFFGTVYFESIGIALLNRSQGFVLSWFLISAIVSINSGIFCFALALKNMEMTIVNCLWAGVSILMVAVIGYFVFEDRYNPLQFFFVFLVAVGLIGLNLFGMPK